MNTLTILVLPSILMASLFHAVHSLSEEALASQYIVHRLLPSHPLLTVKLLKALVQLSNAKARPDPLDRQGLLSLPIATIANNNNNDNDNDNVPEDDDVDVNDNNNDVIDEDGDGIDDDILASLGNGEAGEHGLRRQRNRRPSAMALLGDVSLPANSAKREAIVAGRRTSPIGSSSSSSRGRNSRLRSGSGVRRQKKRGLGHCIHNCINSGGNMNFIQCKSMCH